MVSRPQVNAGAIRARLEAAVRAGRTAGAPIVDKKRWQQVNTLLGSAGVRRKRETEHAEAPLRGLLYCQACQSPMVPSSTRKQNRQYRYYVCSSKAQKQTAARCPSRSLPAQVVEAAVWEQIQGKGLTGETIASRKVLAALIERVE